MSLGQPRETRVVERWDAVFRALASEPRRQVIGRLAELPEGSWASLPGAAQSPQVPRDADRLQRVLVHHHLPLLAEDGFVVWEDDPLRAGRGPAFEEIEAVYRAPVERVESLPRRLVMGCETLETAVSD